ncbi:hypothetical protein [Luteolibacter sp. Populi]|uniref:hypothetical protein n=1 Tax=Luteolibacter sp. Populi TaxID=3230487 RepID=UPI003467798E
MRDARTINYASPPAGHYWRWNAAYDAIEWEDGSTLALWQEVHAVLEELRQIGIPPLGAVLLVVGACREESTPPFEERLEGFLEILGTATGTGEVASGIDVSTSDFRDAGSAFAAIRAAHRKRRDDLVNGFKAIQDLPRELRSSLAAKCLIASTVFTASNFRLSRKDTSTVLDELASAGPRALAGSSPRYTASQRLALDLQALLPGLARKAQRLESLLRTGLEDAEPDPVPLPDSLAADEDPRDLLESLGAAGGECGMAAAVAKRAIAMMNFPGHIGTPRDLPVGGIADITNRGTIDKLLPHELAWDDLVLAARLVHNEALYFRREIPPLNVVVAHTILLDRELRLWGTGRVLSLGIALGLWHHPGLNSPGGSFECVAATDTDFEHLELDSAAKVASALQTLVPTGSPDAFLQAWWDGAQIVDDPAIPDVSLILGKWHLEVETTRKLLGGIATWLHSRNGRFRILALGREGNVEAQAWTPGGNRVLFRGEIDLEEILNGATKPQPSEPLRVKQNPLLDISPVYGLDPLPFLFPLRPLVACFLPDGITPQTEGRGIGVSTSGCLAEWPMKLWGARLLSAKLPGADYWIGRDGGGNPVVITSGKVAGDGAHVFRWENGKLAEIAVEKSKHSFPRRAVVNGDAAILVYSDHVEALSLHTGRRVASQAIEGLPENPVFEFDGSRIHIHKGEQAVASPAPLDAGGKRSIDSTWPMLLTPKSVTLNGGVLSIACGEEIYDFDPAQLAWRRADSRGARFIPFLSTPLTVVPEVHLRTAKLRGMLSVWHDPRGMLHLQRTRPDEKAAIDCWSILLATPGAGVWHRNWQLLAMEPRLRMPGNPPPACSH